MPRGRPKGSVKYNTDWERKAAQMYLRSRYFRLVIPNLQDYKDKPSHLNKLKGDTLNLLLAKQTHLQHYKIAVQTHPTTGIPHLDILLLYSQSVLKTLVRFNYLIKPGHLTRYRKLNQAILAYNDKEDKQVLSNLPKTVNPSTGELSEDTSRILNIADLKKDPYSYLQQQMLKDPLHFNLEQYVRLHNLDPHITGWFSIKTKLKDMQAAAANLQLKQKSGFKYINKALIESNLNSDQLKVYHSWSGYQTIVNYLNQIITHGGYRKMKTLNLLITGPASVGKTSLFHNPNHEAHENPIQDYIAVYPMGMSTWFPQYRSGVYKLILWNEAKLTSYAYDTILKLLQGSYLDLPTKGGVAPKRDNPLIIMTSNLSLQQMIQQKFGYNKAYEQMARKNLAVRVENVVVPPGYDLFLLQKLLVVNDCVSRIS